MKNLNTAVFIASLKTERLPLPVAEHRFHPDRKWRFDFAWPEHLVALEVEGAIWTGGRHTSGAGFVKDMEKYNAAAAMGWRIVRCQPKTLCATDTLRTLRAALFCTPAKYHRA